MAGVDWLSEINKNTKRVYVEKKIENLQNMAAVTFPKLVKSSKKLMGDGTYGGNVVSGNQKGQGSQNELEALRTPGKQNVAQYKVEPKVFTHTIRTSGLAMDMIEGNEAAFADNLVLQMDEGMKDSVKELNAQVFRDGSGTIALCNGGSTGTTITFDTGVPTHFRVGMLIDVNTSIGGTKEVNAIEVTDIDISAGTITLASSQTWSNNSLICRAGVQDGAPTDGKELAGFARITDNGSAFASYEGIVRLGSGFVSTWKGLEVDANSANLTDDLMQRARLQAKVIAGTVINKVVANTSQERKYLSLTLPLIKYDGNENRDSAPTSNPKWYGIEFETDTDCGFSDIWMYDSKYINKFETKPIRFDDTTGQILKWDTGYDAFVAYAKYYGNVGTDRPRAMIRIKNLATPTF
jgi:hypothetical protein